MNLSSRERKPNKKRIQNSIFGSCSVIILFINEKKLIPELHYLFFGIFKWFFTIRKIIFKFKRYKFFKIYRSFIFLIKKIVKFSCFSKSKNCCIPGFCSLL